MAVAFLALQSMATALAADPQPAAPTPPAPPTLAEIFDRHDFQGAILPAEMMRLHGQSVLAVYRVFEAKDGDVEIVYGYAGTDHKSYYRSYALFAKAVRFELVRTAEDRSPLLPAIRDYAADNLVQNFPIRSLLTEMPTTPDRRVTTLLTGACGVPFGAWLMVKDPVDHPLVERMVARVLEFPVPFLEPAGCPLSPPKGSATLRTRARSVTFAQGLPLGDGTMLAIASTDPLVVRFDAVLKAPFLDNDRNYVAFDFGADTQKRFEATALEQAKAPDALPAAALFEQQVWAVIEPAMSHTPPKAPPPLAAKAPSAKPPAKPVKPAG